jgi:RNA polymerase I-specific transcription initiation factor RRN7
MKDRLPSEYQAALDTLRMPLPDDLQLAVYQRSLMYDVFFGMATPPLNHNLLFISYMRSLALPIEVYSLAQRLNRITKYSFAYPDQPTRAESTSRRRHATTYPEAQIISLIVTATKLLFPFDSDSVPRHPKSPNDLATLRMDWSAWLTAKSAMEASSELEPAGSEGLNPGSEMAVTDGDVLNMNDAQLDQYMDWYQRTWLNAAPGAASGINSQAQTPTQSQSQNQETNTIDQTILNLFPLQPLPPTQKSRAEHASTAQKREALLSTRIESVQASLSPMRAITPAEEASSRTTVLRPGARYPRYRSVEELGGTEGWAVAARVFHEEAAQVACLGVPALLRAVARTEDLIEAWRREKRREEHFAAAAADEEEAATEEEDDGSGEPVARVGPGFGLSLGEAPSSSAALVRGLGELELQDIESPSFAAGAGVGGDGEDDEGEADDDGARDIEMEMAMEYLQDL